MSEERQHPQEPAEGADEEVEKKPIAEDAGLVEDEEEYDWEATAQGVRQQPTDQEVYQQENAHHDEGEKEEDKGLLDKVKDKLKGE